MEPTLPPPPSEFVACPRHPETVTGLRCTRCESPVCPSCMIEAPVGYQCPECVERARKEFKTGAGRRLRTAKGAAVTPVLIGIIVMGFVLQQVSSGFEEWALMWPPAIAAGEYWRLLTVILVHANVMHLLVNMWALFAIGSLLEQGIGRARYLALFLVSGFVASATSYAFGEVMVPAVGASGAVFGVWGGLLAYLIRRRNSASARSVLNQLLFWLVLNVVISLQPGIDWRAHLGGLVAGFLTGFLLEEAEARRMGNGAQVAVFVGAIAVGVILVAWRTQQIQDLMQYRVMFGA